jgi:hypothetical protein
LRKYLGTWVIWAFREIFNDNLRVMALKGEKLHPNDIQGIRDFAIAYNGLATFVIAYKELAQHSLFLQTCFISVIFLALSYSYS